jgi:choline dehydrogenase-like flavoprotein
VAPSEEARYDAVVVGSGFGGSIAALRLAEAGKSVLVLERGRRYLPGEFPRDVRDVDACGLAASARDGVVSPEGEVHGYPGLYVADGSVIPTSIGFHPVMTISAVSERIADAAVSSFPA